MFCCLVFSKYVMLIFQKEILASTTMDVLSNHPSNGRDFQLFCLKDVCSFLQCFDPLSWWQFNGAKSIETGTWKDSCYYFARCLHILKGHTACTASCTLVHADCTVKVKQMNRVLSVRIKQKTSFTLTGRIVHHDLAPLWRRLVELRAADAKVKRTGSQQVSNINDEKMLFYVSRTKTVEVNGMFLLSLRLILKPLLV